MYETKAADAVSWYAAHLDRSLAYIRAALGAGKGSVIDVGGGESTLIDDLLAEGRAEVTVLDISAKALEVTQARLGPTAQRVTWLASDVLTANLPQAAYDVWHDRAVFHFLTRHNDRALYVAKVIRSLKPGGFAIVATFGPHGPEQCSGLPVSRYSPQELHTTFGQPFGLLDSAVETHKTPWGASQEFVYCFCRRHAQ